MTKILFRQTLEKRIQKIVEIFGGMELGKISESMRVYAISSEKSSIHFGLLDFVFNQPVYVSEFPIVYHRNVQRLF